MHGIQPTDANFGSLVGIWLLLVETFPHLLCLLWKMMPLYLDIVCFFLLQNANRTTCEWRGLFPLQTSWQPFNPNLNYQSRWLWSLKGKLDWQGACFNCQYSTVLLCYYMPSKIYLRPFSQFNMCSGRPLGIQQWWIFHADKNVGTALF